MKSACHRDGDRPSLSVIGASSASARAQLDSAWMRTHLVSLLVRQYIEHKNAGNLRLHVWSSAVLWTGLLSVLARVDVPVLGVSAAWLWLAGSVIYWVWL